MVRLRVVMRGQVDGYKWIDAKVKGTTLLTSVEDDRA